VNVELDTATLDRLIRVISADRFGTYLAAAGGDKLLAAALYRWNMACSAAFQGPLQVLEVALRNCIHDALTNHFKRADWWSGSLTLADLHRRALVEAEVKASRGGRAATPGRVVAELSFGFWVGLLGRGYEMSLWRPALRHALAGYRGVRADLHGDLDRRRTLRNRIAHHEPIFHRYLEVERDHIIRLTRIIEPVAADWLTANSRINNVLALRPTPGRLPECLF
jgi:hypothetical protein